MPVDPIIARGVEAPDLVRPLLLAEEIKNRRETNKLYSLRQQFEQQQYADERAQAQQQQQLAQTQEAEKRQAIAVYHAAMKGNPQAKQFALQKLTEQNPGLFQGMDPETAWTQIEPIMRQTLGVEDEQPAAAPPMRTRYDGGMAVQEEFDPQTRTWREVGRGSRWQPQAAGGATAQPSPSLTEVVDPADPSRLLRVDAKLYRGGSVGSPGVIGVSGKEPTTAKRDEQRGTSRQAVDELVATLRDQFTQLNEGGGITNTDASVVENVGAGIASSGAGQAVGRLAGTKNQSLRNQIQQTRPRLLSAVMAATGMSARQLDSNAELKLWLSAATDPTLDYQANMEALNNILNLYGSGGSLSGGSQAEAAVPAAPEPPAPGTREGDYIFIGGDPSDPKRWVKVRPEK